MAEKRQRPDRGRRPSFWKAHIKACERSGLSLAEYCRRQGLSYHAFRYWKKKVCRDPDNSQVALVQVGRICSFDKPNRHADRSGRPELGVRINDRFTIEVGDGFSASTLSRLISVIESL